MSTHSLLVVLAFTGLCSSLCSAMRQNYCTSEGSTVAVIGVKYNHAHALIRRRPFEIQDHCRPNWRCKSKTAKNKSCIRISTSCEEREGYWYCEKTCLVGDKIKCKRLSGGRGDPHMTGFDDSTFDFHGRPEAYFLLFGRENGDMLVSKMRAFERLAAGRPTTGTLFKEFGLSIGETGDKIRTAIVPSGTAGVAWKLHVEANGCELNGDIVGQAVNISFPNEKRVEVHTAEHWYTIFLVKGEDEKEGHLDFTISLSADREAFGLYLGVLGMTLNKKIGHKLRSGLSSSNEGVKERAMSSLFEVKSLFPTTTLEMSGVAQFADKAGHEHVHISRAGSLGEAFHSE